MISFLVLLIFVSDRLVSRLGGNNAAWTAILSSRNYHRHLFFSCRLWFISRYSFRPQYHSCINQIFIITWIRSSKTA